MSKERERFDEIAKKIKREADVSPNIIPPQQQIMGRRVHSLQASPGALNTITPCAACKLLRRRCAQECPFSPYFSPHEPHKFASVHKVFGASNVSKMLMEVSENQRADAANSLVYEANVRLRDPVYGCMGAISALQHQIQALQVELNTVKAEILRHKFREANTIIHSSPQQQQQHLPFLSSSTEVVSVAVPPPPPPPPLPPPSQHVASSSSSASLYNRVPTVAIADVDYSTISRDENVTYFVSTSSAAHQLNS